MKINCDGYLMFVADLHAYLLIMVFKHNDNLKKHYIVLCYDKFLILYQ